MFNPQAQSPEVSTRHMLFRQALAAALSARRRSLPPAPESWPALLRAVGKGMDGLLGRQGAREALVEIRTRLFHSPGREAESQTRWHESLATAVFGARVAQLREASVTAVFCGGLLHRSGEAFALKTLARVELEYRLKLDTPSRRDWCTTHGQELTERLVRTWALLPEIATCTLGWRRFGEFSDVSRESTALYFGRLFAIEALQPSFCVPRSIDSAAQDMGVSADIVQQVRAEDARVRELIKNLD
jgi:hypothetical protein